MDGAIVKVNFTEGQFVHEGDALVEIDPRPYQVALEQAQGQLAKDQAQLKDVQIDMERYKLLYKEGVIPKQQVDTQEASVGQSQGSIAADQAAIDTAPKFEHHRVLRIMCCAHQRPRGIAAGGRWQHRARDGHHWFGGDHAVAADLGDLYVAAGSASASDGQASLRPATFRGSLGPRCTRTKITSGKLATIDNQIDVTTGTYKLKAIFGNENEILFPNQFVNVHLLVDTKHNMTLVPVAAIERGPQGTYVYTSGPGNVAKIQAVTVAQTTGNLVGLTSGITAGESVVIDGQDKLQDGTKLNPTQAPMPAVVAATPAKPAAANPARPGAAAKNITGAGSAANTGAASGAAPAGNPR